MKCYFFGTFNPIHLGHIEIARKAKECFNFSDVIFIPSFMPPHKFDELISFEHRFNMLKLAVGDNNVDDIERKLKPPSYTYKTIEELFKRNNLKNGDKINFIIGYDQFFKIESWREPEFLKEKLHFIVTPRKFENGQILAKAALNYFEKKGYSFDLLEIDFLDISSSMIRNYTALNQDITGLTTQSVKEYILKNGLYKRLAKKELI